MFGVTKERQIKNALHLIYSISLSVHMQHPYLVHMYWKRERIQLVNVQTYLIEKINIHNIIIIITIMCAGGIRTHILLTTSNHLYYLDQ